MLQRPAGPPAPPGISLNPLDTGPFTLVPIISLFAFRRTHAVSSNLQPGISFHDKIGWTEQHSCTECRDVRTDLTYLPSGLNSVLRVLTTTARLISPFLTFWILLAELAPTSAEANAIGRARLMTTPISSPTVAHPADPCFVLTLKTLMHSATSPPELSMICIRRISLIAPSEIQRDVRSACP